jgi:hypothetical protein
MNEHERLIAVARAAQAFVTAFREAHGMVGAEEAGRLMGEMERALAEWTEKRSGE